MARNTQNSDALKLENASANLLSVSSERREAIERLARELKGLRAGSSIVLSTHVNSDGDGCGSESALARLLVQMGFKPTVVNPTPWPEMFDFLAEGIDIVEARPDGISTMENADALIVLDISELKRLSILADTVREFKGPVLVIDHHVPGETPFGTEVVSDVSACATGELIYDFATVLGLEVTPEIARAIYVALLTDTGSFRFSNTSARCLAVAAQLLSRGVDPEEMYQRIYASVPIGKIHLLRDALKTLQVDEDIGLAWISVEKDALSKYNLLPENLDGIVEHARSIKGTQLAIFFRELPNNRVKISFRASGAVDTNQIAREFGGGGHKKASGALVDGTLAEVEEKVIKVAREFLERV